MQVATSYFGNRILRHVRTDVRRLREEGFDIVVHTFSENDLRFYRRSMRDIVEVTQEAGMRVWIDPWGVGGVFGGEAFSDVALHHPDWSQVTANRDRLPACCPGHPGFQAFMHEWIDAAVETGADAVFWDEPHLYFDEKEGSGCYCEYCRNAIQFGKSTVGSFLGDMCDRVKSLGRQNVICMLPPEPTGHGPLDWSEIAGLNGVTNLGSTPFWALRGKDPEKYIASIARDVMAVASLASIQTHLWIQGFKIPAGKEDEIRRATIAAGESGVDVVAIWGIDGCEPMSSLSCERPQIAWLAFLKAIAELRGRKKL